ncbi:7-cyano-7-deazaguanine synthase QueC [bacterium]|jgi:7-cyano-7-deazaguanine synthase|nr:7-cyano-7-deazaguanine synthase QueC [bacterium]
MSKALVVFSGGQDSTTCLYWAKQRFDSVRALTFDYGQRHGLELVSARTIAQMAGVEQEVIELGKIFAGLSPLTDLSKPVEAYDGVESLPQGIASTFVPGRNILFLSVAANRAYVLGCDTVVIGVAEQDFGGYPDCRLDFIEKMQAALASGLDAPLTIAAPLMNLTKKDTVVLAQSLPGCLEALAYSTTCYNGVCPPCGHCNSCLLRAKGFEQAGISDPLLSLVQLAEEVKSG